MTLLQKIAVVCISFIFYPANASAVPQLESDNDFVTAGYFQLSWKAEAVREFVLQESTSPDFGNTTVLYRGPDTATLISGRSDGVYYYRIRNRETTSGWSNTTTVTVKHHPLSRALLFFSLGALVFIATLIIVVRGNKANKTSPD